MDIWKEVMSFTDQKATECCYLVNFFQPPPSHPAQDCSLLSWATLWNVLPPFWDVECYYHHPPTPSAVHFITQP